jgi:hypothetical protein
MLTILCEDLGGALPVLDSCPGQPEDPIWMLGQDGKPKRLPEAGRKIFLETYVFKISVLTDVKQVNKRRFAEIDNALRLLNESMRENVARSLATIVEAAGFAGDFRILSHNRSFSPNFLKKQISMGMMVSVAMCGCFMDNPAQHEWDVWPSPNRILSKIRDPELAARIFRDMAVQYVMSQ